MALWDLDYRFRHLLQVGAEGVLDAIGFSGRVRAALIGLPLSERGTAVVFEGNDPLGAKNIERAFKDIDITKIEYIIESMGARKPEARPDYRYSLALSSDLNSRPTDSSWRYFIAPQSASVSAFFVYPALALTTDHVGRVPQLTRTRSDGTVATTSLVSHVIDQLLNRSWLHLASDPNGYGMVSLTIQKFELIRTATAALVAGALDPSGLHSKRDSDMLLSSVSALPYEGRTGQGTITVVPPESGSARIHLHLESPVPVERLHAVRKLMEVATEKTSLLLHQAAIYGVGEIAASAQQPDQELTRICFVGRGSWQLWQGERALLQVKDGTSRLPGNADADAASIADRISWLLPGANLDALLKLARAARHNRHGAMLIISADAAEEARRLAPQSWAVRPAEISDEMMIQLTGMDGGVLVDPQGRCHAIGVILDGLASGMGDPGRGSRFNNPIRYLGTRNAASNAIPSAVVIVYSIDGTVDVLPPYPPRRERAYIVHLVGQLIRISHAEMPDLDDLSTILQRLRKDHFYLSSRQCADLNEALDRLGQSLIDSTNRDAVMQRFEPNPRMNEDRFLF